MIKPILFNTPMVQAILAGRKTCTRRVIKPQPWSSVWDMNNPKHLALLAETALYHPGDILWVRETWCKGRLQCDEQTFYKADENHLLDCFHVRWHPSIHMPKAAARIFLRVKSVRAERLQDIECIASEGVAMLPADNKRDPRCYFTYLWDSTIKKKDISLYGWNANPWVWVIEFERCPKPERWPNV